MGKLRIVMLALLMIASVTTAQHQHTVPNVIKIEGSQELIPNDSGRRGPSTTRPYQTKSFDTVGIRD